MSMSSRPVRNQKNIDELAHLAVCRHCKHRSFGNTHRSFGNTSAILALLGRRVSGRGQNAPCHSHYFDHFDNRPMPAWPYSAAWGYYPVGGFGTILIIVLILALLGYV
jgi:hypothetical protein